MYLATEEDQVRWDNSTSEEVRQKTCSVYMNNIFEFLDLLVSFTKENNLLFRINKINGH